MKEKLKVSMIVWFFSCVINIIWHQRVWVLWVEKFFAQEINIVAILEFIWLFIIHLVVGSYIFKKILKLLFNIIFLKRQTYLNTSGNPGFKWRSQWKNEGIFLPRHQNIKNNYEYPAGRITDFPDPEIFHP